MILQDKLHECNPNILVLNFDRNKNHIHKDGCEIWVASNKFTTKNTDFVVFFFISRKPEFAILLCLKYLSKAF